MSKEITGNPVIDEFLSAMEGPKGPHKIQIPPLEEVHPYMSRLPTDELKLAKLCYAAGAKAALDAVNKSVGAK